MVTCFAPTDWELFLKTTVLNFTQKWRTFQLNYRIIDRLQMYVSCQWTGFLQDCNRHNIKCFVSVRDDREVILPTLFPWSQKAAQGWNKRRAGNSATEYISPLQLRYKWSRTSYFKYHTALLTEQRHSGNRLAAVVSLGGWAADFRRRRRLTTIFILIIIQQGRRYGGTTASWGGEGGGFDRAQTLPLRGPTSDFTQPTLY